ncbi:MAG: 50S ribosomal protein L17 [Desulfobacteraceae bacterium]|nr:MAG: 50S ribosomal protein L17 [Desulfobacteraceae bacterium]
MRHRKAGIKINRTTSHRQAMFRNMVTSLFKYDRIRTTDVKAKELRRWADRIITLAKRGDLHARRLVLSIVREKDVVHKLFENAAKRFGDSQGGYTRIVKIGHRPGDSAPVSLVELVSVEPKPKKGKKKAKADKVEAPKAQKKQEAPAQPPAGEAEAAAAEAAQQAPAQEESVAPEQAPADESSAKKEE